jgi:hypothetical protein
MKLKLDENGNAVLVDGKPVYTYPDGKESPFDVVGTVNTITRLNSEAKANRERYEAAESKLKPFIDAGLEDATAAKKALDVVSNLDAKKLVDAGEVEKVKAEISKAFEAQLNDANTKAQTLEQQLYSEMIGGSFARSKFITEKVAENMKPDFLQSIFGPSFKVEDGKKIAYDQHGQKVFSRSRPGELADFDEALEMLVDLHPHRDHILKSSGASGSGASNTSIAASQGRPDLSKLPPVERMTKARELGLAKP